MAQGVPRRDPGRRRSTGDGWPQLDLPGGGIAAIALTAAYLAAADGRSVEPEHVADGGPLGAGQDRADAARRAVRWGPDLSGQHIDGPDEREAKAYAALDRLYAVEWTAAWAGYISP